MVEKLEIIHGEGDGNFDNSIIRGTDNSQDHYPVSAVPSFTDALYQHGKLQQSENVNNKCESIISIIMF